MLLGEQIQEKDIEKVKQLAAILREEPNHTLEINKRLPSWLENNIGDIGLEKDENVESIAAQFSGHTNQYITLNLNSYGKPEEKGVIYLSISGSIVQMQRREQARDSITGFLTPMKALRLLIEDQDFSISRQKQAKNKYPGAGKKPNFNLVKLSVFFYCHAKRKQQDYLI